MRNRIKTLFIGGAFACIGSLSGHGETFREKLDAYFKEHAKEIQESIREWDVYNLQEQEYRITEQELKDVVLRSYEKTIDWMKLSMQHQIRFFDYYREHLHEDNTVSLKKRFNSEQIRIHALEELVDMRKEFTQRRIDYPKLEELYDACKSYQPDPNDPEGLKNHLVETVERDTCDIISGGRAHYERTLEDNYAIKRLDYFWDKLLCSDPPDWSVRLHSWAISVYFYMGYCTYTKWNPVAYPANWHATTPPYPKFCLRKHGKAIDKMFEDEGLIQTYGKFMKFLPDYINSACCLYGFYRDVYLKFVAKQNPKTMEEEKRRAKGNILFRLLEVDYIKIQDFLKAHTDFGVIARQLEKMHSRLVKWHTIISKLSAQ